MAARADRLKKRGEVPERLKGPVLKTGVALVVTGGSNPPLSASSWAPSALAFPLSQSPPENGKWGLTPLFPPGPRGRPRVPHEGRRLHERPHRDLDRLETQREKELTELALRPHPYEFYLYYDS